VNNIEYVLSKLTQRQHVYTLNTPYLQCNVNMFSFLFKMRHY